MDDFEWDARKAASNARKPGIQFADAVTVLEDDRAIVLRDESHDEERWVVLGMDSLAPILVVVYTWRSQAIRIISAHPATESQAAQYLQSI